ncbi:MAG: WS/DGAT/MGAT family O-acyltransferase [Acidimicrobiales bacterium]
MGLIPPTDALFLIGESRGQPMHVGGLQLFRLPEDSGEEWVRELYEEIVDSGAEDIAPLFRRRPHRSLATLGTWAWVEDTEVDIEHHIRHSALPRPGRIRELLSLTSRLHGTLLDRRRPLWEVHLIEGLADGRFGVYTKVHHSLVDGVSAIRLLQRSLSCDPDDRTTPLPWSIAATGPAAGPHRPFDVSRAPGEALRALTELAGIAPNLWKVAQHSVAEQAGVVPRGAPRTIFNVPITGARRYAAQSWPLERVKQVAKAAGMTLNDVVVAMCAAALRQYLLALDALPDEPMVAMTPVSLRQGEAIDATGNAVGVILCNLATDLFDPLERLGAIHASMEQGKESLRGLTQLQATALSAFAMAPTLAAAIPALSRFAPPPFNIVISNIPGPSDPLYLRGALLEGLYPLSIPVHGQGLNITVTSYNGSLDFGLTGCRQTVPHLQRLLGHLDLALEELAQVLGA